MSIIRGTWADFGYRKVGPKNANDPSSVRVAESFAKTACELSSFERADNGSEIWIRDIARRKSSKIRPLFGTYAVTKATFQKDGLADFLSNYEQTKYSKASNSVLKESLRKSITSEFRKEPGAPQNAYDLGLLFAFYSASYVQAHLIKEILPTFFKVYPNGKAIIVAHDYRGETRFSAVRAGYTIEQYGPSDTLQLKNGSFEALGQWQPLSPGYVCRHLLDLGAALFLPTIPYYAFHRSGMSLVLIPGKKIEVQDGRFPRSWLDNYRSHWDFGRESQATSLALYRIGGLQSRYAEARRFIQNPKFSSSQIQAWVEWIVARASQLSLDLSDPCNFLDSAVSPHQIDFISCFEFGLSADRLLRKGLSAAASDEIQVRKSATMECADIIEGLHSFLINPTQSNRFKELFNPKIGSKLLKDCLQTLPEPVKSNLFSAIDAVYGDLKDKVVGSLYITSKRTPNGILVRDKTLQSEILEAEDEFTANIIRSLRNTHHGYLTKMDARQQRPSRYLALVNGNLPNTMPFLGSLFALAFAADAKTLCGFDPLPYEHFD